MTRIRFTRTVSHEFVVDIQLPAVVRADLDSGLTLDLLSEEADVALYELLSDTSSVPDAAAVDVTAADVVVAAHGTELTMLGDLQL